MQQVRTLVFLGFLTIMMVGCGGDARKVKHKAIYEMNCTRLKVVSLGEDKYGAIGCGQRVSYDCGGDQCRQSGGY